MTLLLIIFLSFTSIEYGKVIINVVQIEQDGTMKLSHNSEIHVDGENDPPTFNKPPVCKTDEDGNCEQEKEAMSYYFRASKDSYRPQRKLVTVKPDSTHQINFKIYHKKYEEEQKKKIRLLSYMNEAAMHQAIKELKEYYENYGDANKIQELIKKGFW